MGLLDTIRNRIAQWLTPAEFSDKAARDMAINNELRREYYAGNHRQQLKTKPGQANDNLTKNYVRLAVDRSVSMMLGGGVDWDTPGDEDEDPAHEALETIWQANGGQSLLHNAALYAAIYGTGYLKILPQATTYNGQELPRIITPDPRWIRIGTMQEDSDTVLSYETRYNLTIDGRERQRRELVTREGTTEDGQPAVLDGWLIQEYIDDGNGRWRLLSEEQWPYDVGPIIHWQNLPAGGTPYGESEIDGIMQIQDRINYTTSNISKILRYHAHPRTWARGQAVDINMSWGPDEIMQMLDDHSMIQNLEMQGDLGAALAYLQQLRQTLFDVSRTIDITSMSDKLGALTNFGLRVLYADALAKTETKRRLMGQALENVNRLLLTLSGLDPEPGDIVWPDTLPRNMGEELQAAQLLVDMGIASKQTIATNMGYDWDEEQERIEGERLATDNAGAALLRAFSQGQGL